MGYEVVESSVVTPVVTVESGIIELSSVVVSKLVDEEEDWGMGYEVVESSVVTPVVTVEPGIIEVRSVVVSK